MVKISKRMKVGGRLEKNSMYVFLVFGELGMFSVFFFKQKTAYEIHR